MLIKIFNIVDHNHNSKYITHVYEDKVTAQDNKDDGDEKSINDDVDDG